MLQAKLLRTRTKSHCGKFVTFRPTDSNQSVLTHAALQRRLFSNAQQLFGASASYHEQMQRMWAQNPASVDPAWREYFEGQNTVLNLLGSFKSGGSHDLLEAQGQAGKVLYFVRNFVQNGHFRADLDPLKMRETYGETIIEKYSTSHESHKATLDFRHYGFTEKDLDQEFYIEMPDWGGLLASKVKWTLRELNEALHKAYCGKIGVEFMHIPERETCKWIRDKIELRQYEAITRE